MTIVYYYSATLFYIPQYSFDLICPYIEYRFDSPNRTGGKSFQVVSYSPLLADGDYPDLKGEGGFIGKMLWDPPYPAYKLHQTTAMWQKENNKKFIN